MTFTPGSRLGAFEIVGLLGAGGMGEVYKAIDSRLDRTVAIKVLPELLAGDPQLRERFDREARALSQLTHPHICTLHDVGQREGVPFLVMEHLEGETLADRLKRGPFALEQALHVAIEVADALSAAHRLGIVHRDVKPGNVMLTKTGAKLVDFGLAKTAAPTVAGTLSMLPTTPPHLTAHGTILGTFQYMAPEQIEGQNADARTDIFAFGVMVYEMIAGRTAFEGKTQASLIGAILKDNPSSLSTFQASTSPLLDHLVRKCLAKEPEKRWQSADDLTDQLRWIAENSEKGTVAPARRSGSARVAWSLVAVVSLAAIAAVASMLWLRPADATPGVVQSSIVAPTDSQSGFILGAAISPDGSRVAFASRSSDGRQLLWVRSLDSVDAHALAGTEGATLPFWSPDGQQIGFFSQRKLKKVGTSGGPVESVCDVAFGRGGTWGRDGTILFAPGRSTVIYRVPSTGGTPVAVTSLDGSRGDGGHQWPSFLPDSRHFLFSVASARDSGIYLGALDSSAVQRLVPGSAATRAEYARGFLFFLRDRILFGQPFDPERQALARTPTPLIQDISVPTGWAAYSVSAGGALVYVSDAGDPMSRLTWVDRRGTMEESIGPPAFFFALQLSHDGRRVAANPDSDVWIYDLATGIPTRLTRAPLSALPVWSPDDRRIVFFSNRQGRFNLYEKQTVGPAEERLLIDSAGTPIPYDWSSDGRWIAFGSQPAPDAGTDIWMYSLTDGKTSPFVEGSFDERNAQFSPDGHWVAYSSDETGGANVFVRPCPGPGIAHRVSPTGGDYPMWRGDGGELFYLAPGGWMHACP